MPTMKKSAKLIAELEQVLEERKRVGKVARNADWDAPSKVRYWG